MSPPSVRHFLHQQFEKGPIGPIVLDLQAAVGAGMLSFQGFGFRVSGLGWTPALPHTRIVTQTLVDLLSHVCALDLADLSVHPHGDASADDDDDAVAGYSQVSMAGLLLYVHYRICSL